MYPIFWIIKAFLLVCTHALSPEQLLFGLVLLLHFLQRSNSDSLLLFWRPTPIVAPRFNLARLLRYLLIRALLRSLS